MYHGLADANHPSGSVSAAEEIYVLDANVFSQQLAFLHEHGYTTVLFADVLAGRPLPDKSVILTFDDGHVSNYTLALPLLKQNAMRAEFFITTEWIGREYFLHNEQIQELAHAGMGIGSHGHSHRYFDDLSPDELRLELNTSKEILQNITGLEVTTLSAPGGRYSERVSSAIADCGYRMWCSSQPGYLRPERFFQVPRFAIKKSTSLEVFSQILAQNRLYLLRLSFRQWILSTLKKLIGNQGYAAVHRQIAHFLNRQK